MKITKQARAALFVMLLTLSILPGCGKNKNQDNGVVVGGGGVILPPGAVASMVVSGQLGVSQTGTFSGTLASPGGAAVGTAYSRNNGYDQIVVYMAPTGSGYMNATAVVTLNQSTIVACGGGQVYNNYPGYVSPTLSVANVQFSYNTVNPANQSLAYSVRVTLSNGCGFNI